MEFHVAILTASGNPFLIQLRELVHTALTISIGLTNRISDHTACVADHEAVLIAIERGDFRRRRTRHAPYPDRIPGPDRHVCR
ncbi:MAG: FCD domain-containing protein [Asticcacaulis sp.]